MKFNKLSKALQPLSLSASSVLDLGNDFKITVMNLNVGNQVYNIRSAEYFRDNPVKETFFEKLFKFEHSAESIAFVANVLMLDWELKDDDGKLVPFEINDAIELLSDDRFGSVVFTKVIQQASTAANFERKWEDVVTKN